MFVAEIWLDIARLFGICDKLKLGGCFGVSRINRAGGLTIFWRRDINIQVIDPSPYFIDAIVNEGMVETWRFSGFYGRPKMHLRHESWNCRRRLHSENSLL